jgi:hypothetical protein
MKLKPGLFQLIIILMTVSLVASCSGTPQANQPNCDRAQAAQPNQKINNCPPSSNSRSGGGSGYYRGFGSRFTNSSPGDTSNSKAGRSGFGSFGRGSHGGG